MTRQTRGGQGRHGGPGGNDVGRYALAQARRSDSVHPVEESSPGSGRRGHHELGADAKRYLCAVEPDYHGLLSRASKRTLGLQGGVMSADETARFAAHRWSSDAIALRRWDDRAKVPGRATRPLSAWEPLLRRSFGRPRRLHHSAEGSR